MSKIGIGNSVGVGESFEQALEHLVLGEGIAYAPWAGTRQDYPELTVRSRHYSPEENEIHLESTGPRDGRYRLILKLSEKVAVHIHADNEDIDAPVEDIKFPSG